MHVAVTVETRTRLSRAWIVIVSPLRFLIGLDRTCRIAAWGAHRFARYRVGGGRWRRF